MEFKFINLDYLIEISDNDASFINEILSLFAEEAPKAASQMESFMEDSSKSVEIGQIAHKLKPSAAYVGNHELHSLLEQLQLLKDEHELDQEAKEKIKRSVLLINELEKEIKIYLESIY